MQALAQPLPAISFAGQTLRVRATSPQPVTCRAQVRDNAEARV